MFQSDTSSYNNKTDLDRDIQQVPFDTLLRKKVRMYHRQKFITYTFDTNDRPFNAIKTGIKKVEGRTLTEFDKTPYDKLRSDDSIIIVNNLSNETLKVKISFVHHYSSVKEMLEKEGPENVLSGEPKTLEDGIRSYNSLNGYKESIKKNGIYAIGLELL